MAQTYYKPNSVWNILYNYLGKNNILHYNIMSYSDISQRTHSFIYTFPFLGGNGSVPSDTLPTSNHNAYLETLTVSNYNVSGVALGQTHKGWTTARDFRGITADHPGRFVNRASPYVTMFGKAFENVPEDKQQNENLTEDPEHPVPPYMRPFPEMDRGSFPYFIGWDSTVTGHSKYATDPNAVRASTGNHLYTNTKFGNSISRSEGTVKPPIGDSGSFSPVDPGGSATPESPGWRLGSSNKNFGVAYAQYWYRANAMGLVWGGEKDSGATVENAGIVFNTYEGTQHGEQVPSNTIRNYVNKNVIILQENFDAGSGELSDFAGGPPSKSSHLTHTYGRYSIKTSIYIEDTVENVIVLQGYYIWYPENDSTANSLTAFPQENTWGKATTNGLDNITMFDIQAQDGKDDLPGYYAYSKSGKLTELQNDVVKAYGPATVDGNTIDWINTTSHTGDTPDPNTVFYLSGNGKKSILSRTMPPPTVTKEENDAVNIGVSADDIEIFTTVQFTKISGKANLDNTRKDKIQSLLSDTNITPTQRRKKRGAILKLLFSQDSELKKMKISKEALGLPAQFTKANAIVVKAGEPPVDLSTLADDEGVYSVLDDGETFKVSTDNTTLTFTRNDDGQTELYRVTSDTWTDIIINSDDVNGSFKSGLNTGTLLPDDKVSIDGRLFIIGSVAVGGTSGSGADPYVYPINSSVPVKLPNKCATYRMFEQGDNYVNVEVGRANDDHQERMLEYAEKLTHVTHNVVCDGYFYHKAFISAEGHALSVDYRDKKVRCNSDDIKFFTIKQSKKKFDCGEFGDDSHCMTVAWETKEGKKIHTEIMFFQNPHIENGINVIPETTKKSTGLIVTNYKPKLMKLPSISTLKYDKLHRRLNNTENVFQKKTIKGKNEKWHFKK